MNVRVSTFPRSANRNYPTIVRGEGVYLFDSTGKRYLDASSGAVVANIGHGRKEIAEVAARQIGEVAFVHGSQFSNKAMESLSSRLESWLPGGEWKFFPASGGSEAVEAAIKFARQYHIERGNPSKFRVVTRKTGYHGATLGALAASGIGERRSMYGPILAEDAFPKVDKPDPCSDAVRQINELKEAISHLGEDTIAAFLFEPIMGASDPALAPSDNYYQEVTRICARHDILIVADEVMCGLGRTGTKLGIDHWDISPDVIVLGKGLAAGYAPMAGIAVREEAYRAISEGSGSFRHGYTYSGHPVSAAVGAEVLRILEEENLVERSTRMGRKLLTGLRQLKEASPLVREVRGVGMLTGVFLGSPETGDVFEQPGFAFRVGDIAREHGLNLYPGTGSFDSVRGDHLLIAPPLTLSDSELEELIAQLGTALQDSLEDARAFWNP